MPNTNNYTESPLYLLSYFLVAWDIDARDLGGMTHKRDDGNKGFEPDTCFYLAGQGDADEVPMLAIETDITNPSLQKLPLYAAWQYRGVWRFTLMPQGDVLLTLYVLTDAGYVPQEKSGILSPLTRTEIAAFVKARIGGECKAAWAQRVNAWADAARPDAGEPA